MARLIKDVVVSESAPVGNPGCLWIKYTPGTKAYQLMVPVGNGWQEVNETLSEDEVKDGLGYTPENNVNKVTSLSAESTDTQYPSAKAVYDAVFEALEQTYLTKFDTVEEFNAAKELLEIPNVSLVAGELVYTDCSWKYYEYFTIEATEDGTTVYFRQSHYANDEGLDALKVEVSTDNGQNWTEVTAAVAEDDVPGATLATLDAGEKVLIRGRNEAYGYYSESESDCVENCNFWADRECKVSGNIMSLVGGDDFAIMQTVNDCAFSCLFCDYELSLSPWVVDAEDLLLPATTLAQFCYYTMFGGCTGLTTAPVLPATTLAQRCYEYMFYSCTGLTSAPELPATTLAQECYGYMFYGCTGLTSAPTLLATTLADDCYFHMFGGCTNLAYIKALFTTTPGYDYTDSWVEGVAANGTFVKSASATWNVTGENGVPSGWTVETE